MADTPTGDYRPEIRDFLDDMLINAFPGVTSSKAFGYPAYKIGGRIFAFVGGQGIALKLGAVAVRRLVQPGTPYSQFTLENGTVWKDWLSIDHDDPTAYEDDLQLFADSIARVRGA